jgi:hypothetical protein
MPRVGFERTVPAFERAKVVHVLNRTATVTGKSGLYLIIYQISVALLHLVVYEAVILVTAVPEGTPDTFYINGFPHPNFY